MNVILYEKKNLLCILISDQSAVQFYVIFFTANLFLLHFQGKHSHSSLALARAVAVDILNVQFQIYSISGIKTSKGTLGQPSSLVELLVRRQSDTTGLHHKVPGLAE